MDWNLKATSWDLSEFKQEAIPNIDGFERSNNGGDFSIDLKLGRVGNSNGPESNDQWKQPAVSKMESSSPSVSAKRTRATKTGTQATFCLVDGCNADLSSCRDYHRRHKVCEFHSKSPQVTIGGLKQRFCQQCSRFHSLEEFDEGKRSCRKRLDGHNRRRRKPQPDLLSRSGSFWSYFKGSQLLPFSSSSHAYPSTTLVSPTWSGAVTSEADATTHIHYSPQQQMHMPSKQNLPFECSLSKSYKENNVGGSYSMFCDRLTTTTTTTTQVQSSDCALSLLSSTQTQTSGNRIVQLQQPNSIPLVQSLDTMDSALDAHGPNHSPWSSANKSPLTLPFNWE
ncbi:hypothetical protein JCGZ_26430 [Jatropha curcas]|uniref:SBP-type domain-containing protein n=1 Tax=Jatropha curcas TaxID=180498 RepID=A0A067JSU4_JATCU|nr:squamosa promoter-binding-like protein 13A isoform X1 [Jatropha curcas]KDP22599.1 hypothetical protein JCGZ_26430 [Jatropha curcas]